MATVATIVRHGTGCGLGRGASLPRAPYRERPFATLPPAMGQPITVIEKPTTTPGVVRFETNRNLTGMGHERYRSGDDAVGARPVDELARRLFARGGVDGVHVYGNIVTVDISKGMTSDGMLDVIHELFVHYVPGVLPPTDEELLGGAAPA